MSEIRLARLSGKEVVGRSHDEAVKGAPMIFCGRGFIDVCIGNDRFGKPNTWKSRLPLVAFRSLAMQASIEGLLVATGRPEYRRPCHVDLLGAPGSWYARSTLAGKQPVLCQLLNQGLWVRCSRLRGHAKVSTNMAPQAWPWHPYSIGPRIACGTRATNGSPVSRGRTQGSVPQSTTEPIRTDKAPVAPLNMSRNRKPWWGVYANGERTAQTS